MYNKIKNTKDLEKYIKKKVKYYYKNCKEERRFKNYKEVLNAYYFTDKYNYPGSYYFYREGQWISNNYERGGINEKIRDLDEMIFAIFNSITLHDATYYERKRRVPGRDTRRIWFPKQIELLSYFGEEYVEKCRENQNETLVSSPFEDDLHID